MTLSDWFQSQLKSTADGFVWAAEQVPPERREISPPHLLGEWTAARHVFHLAYYERNAAIPGMCQWLGEPARSEREYDEDRAWSAAQDLASSLSAFREGRAEQIQMLGRFDERAWRETRETLWGPVTLLWVVSKTFQHTAEHTHDTMRMALFWDRFEAFERNGE